MSEPLQKQKDYYFEVPTFQELEGAPPPPKFYEECKRFYDALIIAKMTEKNYAIIRFNEDYDMATAIVKKFQEKHYHVTKHSHGNEHALIFDIQQIIYVRRSVICS